MNGAVARSVRPTFRSSATGQAGGAQGRQRAGSWNDWPGNRTSVRIGDGASLAERNAERNPGIGLERRDAGDGLRRIVDVGQRGLKAAVEDEIGEIIVIRRIRDRRHDVQGDGNLQGIIGGVRRDGDCVGVRADGKASPGVSTTGIVSGVGPVAGMTESPAVPPEVTPVTFTGVVALFDWRLMSCVMLGPLTTCVTVSEGGVAMRVTMGATAEVVMRAIPGKRGEPDRVVGADHDPLRSRRNRTQSALRLPVPGSP